MKPLYPSLAASKVHSIRLTGLHEIHVEECGNPEGIPVIFLHGGPGSGCSPEHRRYLDPAFYRIVLFDQRGCGRSLPLGETQNNTTWDLISDMETIRRRLEIDKWMVFGGSWGATLALLYALTHPDRMLAMVLRGVFLARETDLHWFFFGLRRLLPQAWEALSQGIPFRDWRELIDWYWRRVNDADPELSLTAAGAWSDWSTRAVTWQEGGQPAAAQSETERMRLLAKVRIETHYAHHRYFIGDNEILQRIDGLPQIPVTIVHGLRDLVCNLQSAWLLHRSIDRSRLVVVKEAGHLMSEPAMAAALVEETDRMRMVLT